MKLMRNRNYPIFQRHHRSAQLQTLFGFQQHKTFCSIRKAKMKDVWETCVFDLLNLKDFQVKQDGKKQALLTKNTQSSSVLCPGK